MKPFHIVAVMSVAAIGYMWWRSRKKPAKAESVAQQGSLEAARANGVFGGVGTGPKNPAYV